MTAERTLGDELVIVVYLDTNVLLDLLATVQDGFTLVERITSGQSRDTSAEKEISAEFGAPGVLHLFKLGLSGKLGRTNASGTSSTTEADVTHTYGSLLHRLRKYLINEGLVHPIDDHLKPGQFVEFTGVVRPNPFTGSFRQLQRMLKVVRVGMAMAGRSVTPQMSAKPGRAGQPPRVQNPELAQLEGIDRFLDQLMADVEREGTSTVLVDHEAQKVSAVVTLYEGSLRDRSMAELLNREFRVLGKVARYLPIGSAESVDMIGASGIAGFSPEVLEELLGTISKMSAAGIAKIELPRTEVEPPVIEIIPVAIYL